MLDFAGFTLSYLQIMLLACVAILSGMGKAGLYGAGLISVPLMAFALGGKDSTGILLLLLIIADIFAVVIYRRDANWVFLRQLLPAACVGIVFATIVGAAIDDQTFQRAMAIVIVVCVVLMVVQELRNSNFVPSWPGFASSMGIVGGFTSMIGNLGAPVLALYFLAMRVPKREFLGTAAWFFLSVNLIKVPFHVYAWHTINFNTVILSLSFLPLIGLGVYLATWLVRYINEVYFRRFVIMMTLLSAVVLLK